jgi:hypothetical protein
MTTRLNTKIIKNPLAAFPPPACKWGYTRPQVIQMMGLFIDKFDTWMDGQTVALCDGREYDHEQKKYVSSCDVAHGTIYYADDVRRYALGLPVID